MMVYLGFKPGVGMKDHSSGLVDSTLPGSSHWLERVQVLPKNRSESQKGYLCNSWKASESKGTDSSLPGKGSPKKKMSVKLFAEVHFTSERKCL